MEGKQLARAPEIDLQRIKPQFDLAVVVGLPHCLLEASANPGTPVSDDLLDRNASKFHSLYLCLYLSCRPLRRLGLLLFVPRAL